MDITLIKDGLVHFTIFKRTSKFRKYLSLLAWLFLAFVPVLDNKFFGNNISQLRITTNIALTLLLIITFQIYNFNQGSSVFFLKTKNYIVRASGEITKILLDKSEDNFYSKISEKSLNDFKSAINRYIEEQKNETSWEKAQTKIFEKNMNIVGAISTILIFIFYVYNLIPMINSVLVFPTSFILTFILLISKPTNEDIINFYSSRRDFSITMSALEELSNIILETGAFEDTHYPNIRKFFKFAISCDLIRKKAS